MEDLGLSTEELYDKSQKDPSFCKLLARHVSINASRQSTKIERMQLDVCNCTDAIKVRALGNKELRPTKDGRVMTKQEFKQSGLKKNDCLKSFDGVIEGLVNGYIFAKVCYTAGGHQDNVFEEAHQFGEWAWKHRDPKKIYVMLIDTDLDKQLAEKLKNKYPMVMNHVELQEYFLYQKEINGL